ncbi:aminotransferase class V-fold PLP-dependent enzyme [Streptomyces sp. SYSU K217416]
MPHSFPGGPEFPGGPDLFRLDPAVAHLNHGSFGTVPVPVQAVQDALREEQERDPDAFHLAVPDRVAAARARIAAHLGAEADGIALIPNVTEGINVVLNSLRLDPEDEILVTDHGYGTVSQAAARRARLRIVSLGPDAPDEDAVRDRVLAAVTGRTRVAVLDHITSPTARVVAGKRLLAALAERGVTTVVDGAHAPGMLPDPLAGAPDFWFGNLHKWAYAPRGTAVLAVAPRWRPHIRPLAPSWEDHHGFPRALEWRGTIDYTPWLAAPDGLDLLARLDAPKVRAHNTALAAYGQHLLAERAGLRPLPYSEGVAMRALRLPPGVAETRDSAHALLREIADRLRTRVLVWPWPGGGGLRICAQIYNHPREYEHLADGLAALLDGRRP